MKTLLSDDVPEPQAKAAVLASDCDLTNCQLWVLEHQHDTDLIGRLAEEFDETFGKTNSSSNLCFMYFIAVVLVDSHHPKIHLSATKNIT